MVNLRNRSKAKDVPPRAPKTKPVVQIPSTAPDLSEAALRKLSRAALQKLAMAHKIKANVKSELIIQQLSSLHIPQTTRRAEIDPEEGPSRKRVRTSEEAPILGTAKNERVSADAQPGKVQTSAREPQLPESEPFGPRSTSPVRKAPIALSYDKDLFSGTESEMTEEEQLDFATPVSSREETPPPAHVNNLKRCVRIMQEISARDVTLQSEVESMHETAAKLRKRARDVRDLVKAERGRRERMETYFRYWQETEPSWDREWLYGKKTQANKSEKAPAPSPEELKQRREAIIAKQEAERRELEALWRREIRDRRERERSPSESSSQAESDCADLLPTNEDGDNAQLIPYENNARGMAVIRAMSPK